MTKSIACGAGAWGGDPVQFSPSETPSKSLSGLSKTCAMRTNGSKESNDGVVATQTGDSTRYGRGKR